MTLADGSAAESHYPTEASQVRLQELLERRGVAFDSRERGSSTSWSIFTYLLPFALFFGYWLFLTRQVQGHGPALSPAPCASRASGRGGEP